MQPRRALLLGGAALALTSCSDPTPAVPAAPRATTRPDPDVALRRQAADNTTALITAYDAAIAAHPGLTARLTPLRAQLLLHRAAFSTTRPRPGTTAGATPGRSAAAIATPAAPAPATPAATLAALAAAERRIADTRTAALATASPELARLLASTAAAGAVHAHRLTA
ncbi:hypothetical protein [Peterkaempfera sp. SMS 1(5)a]|uniref:hypothetical protein n=1 Tax=Peterkaempfera podocarpi TaxID=3232308 RepID=UPI00366F6241